MARTHRYSSSSSTDAESVPRFFGKTNDYDYDPHKLKKNGSGKYNWGNAYDDIDDYEASSDINFANARRRSNSTAQQNPVRFTAAGSEYADVFDEEE